MLKGHQMLKLMLMLGCCALAMAKPPAAVKQEEAKSQLKAGDSESDTSIRSSVDLAAAFRFENCGA